MLPEILPTYFPESKEFCWLGDKEFKPEEILECEEQKKLLEEEYNHKLSEVQEKEKEIYIKYQFLKDLLIQSGESLVEAVCEYLKWIGFKNVIIIDGSEDILREDIQIIDNNDMYIIEVKGIGGTSTDAECAQVAKHRRKREKENREKNVIPIYIVNHQRYIKPQLRENPPFNKNQIDYAINDERGLLTTWQLYQQFKLIQEGIFTKEETREAFKEIGVVTLIPKELCSIGIVAEYFKNAGASILHIKDADINIGDVIWARKDQVWKKGNICSIQINDKDVEKVSNGEIGLVLDIEISKGFELFIKRQV